MKCPISLFTLALFIALSCQDEPVSLDITPPTASITEPKSWEKAYEIVTIKCNSSDDKGVEKVE